MALPQADPKAPTQDSIAGGDGVLMRNERRRSCIRTALVMAVLLVALTAGDRVSAAPIGAQFAISQMAALGEPTFLPEIAVAYSDPATDRFLVVWSSNNSLGTSGGSHDGTDEIWGRLYTGAGAPVGAEFQISDMGLAGDTSFHTKNPAVAYNSADEEFLVVWSGDSAMRPPQPRETEIFGQRLTVDGAQVGANDFQISNQGKPYVAGDFANYPAVTFNSELDEYLVVWTANTRVTRLALVPEQEIYAQRLGANGSEKAPEKRVSTTGFDGQPSWMAAMPDVAYNNVADEYLVVWTSNAPTYWGFDIMAQRLGAGPNNAGVEIGGDFQISYVGAAKFDYDFAAAPAISFDPDTGRYLVVWLQMDKLDVNAYHNDIWGQLLGATGKSIGKPVGPPVQYSQAGPAGTPNWVGEPDVVYSPSTKQHTVVFSAGESLSGTEIYGQAVTPAGAESGVDYSISSTGIAHAPALAHGSLADKNLLTWLGEDPTEDHLMPWGRQLAP